MAVSFYCVNPACRTNYDIDDSAVKVVIYERTTKNGTKQVRYALKASCPKGHPLTKFCSEDVAKKYE